MDALSLYWKNATAEAVGEKHGVADKDLRNLAGRVKQIHQEMSEQRKAATTEIARMGFEEPANSSFQRAADRKSNDGSASC